MLSTVAAVVVHHRSYETVSAVVGALLHQGVLPENLVLIDNSEEPTLRSRLRELIPHRVVILFEETRGYGAAVNAGIDYFDQQALFRPEFLLVSTHETRPEPGALVSLLQALLDDLTAAVAGPTLVSGTETEFVWSAGGYLAPLSHIPTHHHHRAPLAVLQDEQLPVRRAWLDGAFLLYRWNDIHQMRTPERFFLYMEETDLHLNLAKVGRIALWVPSARVWQD